MKKATNRILSFLTAFAMVIGVLVAPFTSANAAETGETTTEATETESLTIHKILLTEDALGKHDENKDYNGGKIKNIQDFFGDTTAEEIDGVYFKLQKLNDEKDAANAEKLLKDDTKWTDVENKAGKTDGKAGLTLDTKGLSGTFRIVEVLEKSTYKGPKGEVLANSKAVPTLLTLPMVNEQGIIKEGHVYPKNTQDMPKVDKDFKDQNTLRPVDEKDADEIHGGANVDDNQREKKIATTDLGENVPYEIKTVIPAHTKYKTLAWDDTMSKGLTFNDDVTLKIGGTDATLGTDYIVSYKDGGFVIQLLQAGLDKVYDKDADTEIYITYSATVNGEAEVDKTEKNKLDFYYDNNVSVKGKPEPTNPVNGNLKVTKNFPNVEGGWVEGEEVIVTIIDEETGKPVDFSKLEDKEAKKQSATVVLTKDKQYHEWTGLDNSKKYKVVETFKPSEIVTYEEGENGEVIIKDEIKPEDEQPKKITPSVPEVILGGKKFVKTNQDGTERLEGAEFYVKNADGEYLVPSAPADNEAVSAAKAELDNAVKEYNDLGADAQDSEEGKAAKALADEKQKVYNEAVFAHANKYDFVPATKDGIPAEAVVLTSNADGQFEIKGLAYAEGYQLEEKTAPEGYAKLDAKEEQLKFEVKEGSYNGSKTEFNYEAELGEGETQTYGQQIKNKKVTIPQTGGIGSLIFIVAGLALMGVAFVAMKRRNTVEA